MATLTRKEAIKLLNLDEKVFNNYFKNADEFSPQARPNNRGRFMFDEDELKEWLERYKWRTVNLDKDDYVLCLDFALAQHFRGYVLSDWGSARQREFGQKITNWVKGQLAEVAVKKFLNSKFGVDVELDFDIHDEIVPQDIVNVLDGGKMRKPKIGIGIKSSKPKSAFLILSENEVELKERQSDAYILCRPDIPDDHLLRITRERIIEVVKDQQHYSGYSANIPDFADIPCEVAGWIDIKELERKKASDIPGLEEASGYRYIKKSGNLNRDRKSWEELLSRL